MNLPAWREEPIGKHHQRTDFDCSSAPLNEYLNRFARQDHESGGAKAFVAVPLDTPDRVMGFYTLSPASITFSAAPESLRRGRGRYEIGAFRLGRLAVDQRYSGKGLGGQLLMAAGRRCLAVAEQVGGVALIIDAKDERAAEWLREFGAHPLLDTVLTLAWPLATVKSALISSSQSS